MPSVPDLQAPGTAAPQPSILRPLATSRQPFGPRRDKPLLTGVASPGRPWGAASYNGSIDGWVGDHSDVHGMPKSANKRRSKGRLKPITLW